ncbi:MAG: hypothetical protein JXQ87_03425 [Bacteroidia bacterium]
MRIIDKLLWVYYLIPNFQNTTVLSKAINVAFARILKKIFDFRIEKEPHRKPKIALNKKSEDDGDEIEIIASLTSFPSRINSAHVSIEGIFSQTIRPNRVILWLATEQFPNEKKDLPQTILNLEFRGLEIRFCDDIRSHKKYHYAIQENPNSLIVTFDDDLYYPKGIIKNLLTLHKKYPNCVVATRTHKMTFKQENLLPYKNWLHNYNKEKPSLFLMHTSGAGTLFPATIPFDSEFFNKDLFMKLSPKSDDVWMKVNLIRLGVKVVTNDTFNKDPITVKAAFSTSLVKTNSFEGGKDEQMKKVLEYFKLSINGTEN